MSYRYDPDTRAYVARLLWEALPAYYRDKDRPPGGQRELEAFLQILAAPLAIARQSIEELHSNLFIDTSEDWVIALLARMVGTTLVFPDAASNRRDVRDTVSWRRRKGTPLMLQDLGGSLTGHLVVTREGWKLVQISQDLNLLRPERVAPDLRPPIVAELDHGPLVSLHHAVDARAITETTGKYHPRQVIHWAHPTQLFEVRRGSPADLRDALTDPDFRYSFHPLGEFVPMRARRTGQADALRTDGIPPLHFAAAPGDWFGRDGRFTVWDRGIPAAMAVLPDEERTASALGATPEVMDGSITLTLLRHDARRFRGAVRVQVIAAAVAIPGPAVPDTNPLSIDLRAEFDIDAGGATPTNVVNAAPVDPARLVMLRLVPVLSPARFFPGADIEIAGDSVSGVLGASASPELAREGFLRGSLFVRLPAALVNGERWYFVAADGSVYDAQSASPGPVDVAVSDTGGQRVLPADRLRTSGSGPAWPPLPAVFDPEPLVAAPSAPGLPPSVMHGGRVLRAPGGIWQDVAGGAACALVFAASFFDGVRRYRPFLRLAWNGPDPAGAAATVVGNDGLPSADPAQRFRAIADLREAGANQFRMAIRFESDIDDAILAEVEVAYTSYDGRSTLLHLPALACQAANPAPEWSADAAMLGISEAVVAGKDGSTWQDAAALNARMSAGQVAPLAAYRGMRRRRVHYRSLCAWRNEVPPLQMHAATQPGFLDVDPAHGLFAMAAAEAPGAGDVSVTYQEGYTRHTGARSAAREPELDQRLDSPTRLVTGGGSFHEGAPPEWHDLPRYASLTAALADIQAAPQAREVIQIEDSFTYTAENWTWPANCQELIVQAAEIERPVIDIAAMGTAAGATYDRIVLRGLTFGGSAGALGFAPSALVQIQFCTVTGNGNQLMFQMTAGPEQERIEIIRSVTAGLLLDGPGTMTVADSVVDTGANLAAAAITAAEGRVELERVTVFGLVSTFVLEASEVIFNDDALATDRFHGCVRYSRVTDASVLPRRHRVVTDVRVRYVSVNRNHPAHARLAESCDRRILRGSEDGSEMGAFHDVQQAQRYEAFFRRLVEYTPAGLTTGIIRVD